MRQSLFFFVRALHTFYPRVGLPYDPGCEEQYG